VQVWRNVTAGLKDLKLCDTWHITGAAVCNDLAELSRSKALVHIKVRHAPLERSIACAAQ
jgi:hypothetical protein